MSVDISKRTTGGFTVVLYGTLTNNIAELTYHEYTNGIRLVNNNGGWQSPDPNDVPLTPADWTISGSTGFTTFEEVANALDLLGVKLHTSSGGGTGGSGDASQAQQIISNDLLTQLVNLLSPKSYEYVSTEPITDGASDFLNVVKVEFKVLRGEVTINGVIYEDTTIIFDAPQNGTLNTGISYVLGNNAKLVINYTKLVV